MEHLDIKGLTNYQATLGEQLARQVTYILLIYVLGIQYYRKYKCSSGILTGIHDGEVDI